MTIEKSESEKQAQALKGRLGLVRGESFQFLIDFAINELQEACDVLEVQPQLNWQTIDLTTLAELFLKKRVNEAYDRIISDGKNINMSSRLALGCLEQLAVKTKLEKASFTIPAGRFAVDIKLLLDNLFVDNEAKTPFFKKEGDNYIFNNEVIVACLCSNYDFKCAQKSRQENPKPVPQPVVQKTSFIRHNFLQFAQIQHEVHFTSVDDKAQMADVFRKLEPFKDKSEKEVQSRNPDINALSPYKLHISLSKDSYTPGRCNRMREIIDKYLHVIPGYKFVVLETLEQEQKEIKACHEFLSKAREVIKQAKKLTSDDCSMMKGVVQRYDKEAARGFGSWRQPKLADIEKYQLSVITELNSITKAMQRFSNADQFTLYIPTNVNKENLLRLCQELDFYLEQENATHGNTTAAELKIGKYINFRQEHTLEDYKDLSKNPSRYERSRISANETWEYTLERIQSEMQQSVIYKYLSNQLTIPVPKDKWQKVWDDNANENLADKACALLKKYACSYDTICIGKDRFKAGSVGRFFSGRWNSHHGDAVECTLNDFDKLDKEERTLNKLLDLLKEKIGNNPINSKGDLRWILATIRINSEACDTLVAQSSLNNSMDIMRN